LYHWRVVQGSASVDPDAKPYAYDAAQKALQEAVDRRGWEGTVSKGRDVGYYEVRFRVAKKPRVAVFVFETTCSEATGRCISSVMRHCAGGPLQAAILTGDGGDTRVSAETISGIACRRYEGFQTLAEACNVAASEMEADCMLFLGSDVEVVSPDLIGAMAGYALRSETGAVGGKILYPDGTIMSTGLMIDPAGRVTGLNHRFGRDDQGYNGMIRYARNVSAVPILLMMMRKDLFEAVGGFDPALRFYADIDLCLRLRERGLLIVYQPAAESVRHGPIALSYDDLFGSSGGAAGEREIIAARWDHLIGKGDPYYNPNLRTDTGDFSIRV
ncbi:MAG TPA: glycosyltransferase, partial [Dissulfurispiraceae bacterium]|nr:glycosyltransferase [Dissulfurispiraceae bacterium]